MSSIKWFQKFILEGDSIIVHRALCETSTLPFIMEPVILGMHALWKYYITYFYTLSYKYIFTKLQQYY